MVGRPEDDHGGDINSATVFPVNSSLEGELEESSDEDYFQFTLSQNTTITLTTSSSIDTVGALYDSQGSLLASNDDGGVNRNFRISSNVSADTYDAKVSGYGSTTGSYIVSLDEN